MQDGHATQGGQTLIGWGMAAAVYPARRSPASARARLNADGSGSRLAGSGRRHVHDHDADRRRRSGVCRSHRLRSAWATLAIRRPQFRAVHKLRPQRGRRWMPRVGLRQKIADLAGAKAEQLSKTTALSFERREGFNLSGILRLALTCRSLRRPPRRNRMTTRSNSLATRSALSLPRFASTRTWGRFMSPAWWAHSPPDGY